MKKVILFDIDGTLMDSGEAGSRALDRVFLELFSIPDAFSHVMCAGKTDIQIVREGLSLHGLAAKHETIEAIAKTYVGFLQKEIVNGRRKLMPGVVDLLETLKSRSDYPFGLLTGNLREAARIKLQAVSIHHYFSFGAYGDDHEDRNRLLPKAAERFTAATGISANYGDFVVIGDTPLDVQCSKPYGALSIAVCTGSYSSSSLIEAGADYVLKDLTAAINIIENL